MSVRSVRDGLSEARPPVPPGALALHGSRFGDCTSRHVACSQEGFSLVEALVAVAILALCVSMVGRVVSSRAERLTHDTDRLRAVFAAEAILNRIGLDLPLRTQDTSGQLGDGSHWRIVIRPYIEPGFRLQVRSNLLHVSVQVAPARGAERNAVVLNTLRLPGSDL
ncbi:type II secretion system protein [Methylorubrum thiocyanatum]|uniref:type II secretion system protein n=1 Tax=Methylorubrum thiocyanatum TaxID=47958 RepID=UPI003F8232FA